MGDDINVKIAQLLKDYEHLVEKLVEMKEAQRDNFSIILKDVDKVKEDIIDIYHLVEIVRRDVEELDRKRIDQERICKSKSRVVDKLEEYSKESLTKRLLDEIASSRILSFIKFVCKAVILIIIVLLSAHGLLSFEWLKVLW